MLLNDILNIIYYKIGLDIIIRFKTKAMFKNETWHYKKS